MEQNINDTENLPGATDGDNILHHQPDNIEDNTENNRETPHSDDEDESFTHGTRMRYFLNAYEGNWKQLIITTDDRLNQTKPPERDDWICFVPPRAWKTALKNILSRTQYQDNWLIGYITEVTDITNRECNITIQGQTSTATMSLIQQDC